MGVVTRLLRQPEKRDALSAAGSTAWLQEALLGPPSATGLSVTPEISLRYTAVLACVRVLAEGVASLPCILYERFEQNGLTGKRRAGRHPVYRLLHDAPNPVQTAFEFDELGMAHLALWGNFYAEIEWNARGQVVALWPLAAWRVTPAMTRQGKVYRVQIDNGPDVLLSDYQVLHIPGFGYDGVAGKSMISLAREAVGLGLAAERYGGSVFGNGVVPGGVLEHPGQLSDEAYARLQQSWAAQHQGLANAQRLAILEEGMKYDKVGIPPEDAQFLETRKFQRSEIAGIFRVPLHMIGDLERATFSNIEHQSTEFLTNSLAPWLRRWEQRINRSLLVGKEQQRYFAEFLVDALLRGDTATRYAAYATGRQWGWLSVNDIRQRENMNPVEGGDEYLVPLNMTDAGGGLEHEGAKESEDAKREGAKGLDTAAAAYSTNGAATRAARTDVELRGAVAGRRRLAEAHRAALEDAIQRVLNRESNDILNALRRKSTEEFTRWLSEFLVEHREFWKARMWATVWALALLAADEARREAAGYDGEMSDEEAERFTRGMVSGHATGWCDQLQAHIEQRIEAALLAGEDPAAAVEALIQTRRDEMAAGWARDMGVTVVNALAVAVWTAVGVQALRWVAFNDNCPYCAALNGRTVGIAEFFVPVGGEVAPEGQPPLRPHRNTRHAPLHDGCDCMVVIG